MELFMDVTNYKNVYNTYFMTKSYLLISTYIYCF